MDDLQIQKLKEAATNASIYDWDEEQSWVDLTGSEAEGSFIHKANPAAILELIAQLDRAEKNGMETAAKMCDLTYEIRANQGFAREASTARALAAAIREYMVESKG